MSENVGTIEYTVSADTSELLNSGKQVTTVTGQMEKAFDSADKSVSAFNTSVSKVATGVNQATKSAGNMRGVFGQLGYQIQDVSVQLQMGQNAMMVFAQQGSQIASIFGPGGAVIGAIIAVSGALASALIPNLLNTESQSDKTKDAIDALGKVIKFSESGVAALSNEYATLAKTNATLATQLRNTAIQKYALEVKKSASAITEVVQEQSSWFRSLGGGVASVTALGGALDTLHITTTNFNDAISQASAAGVAFQSSTNTVITTVGMLSDQLGITDQQAFELAKQMSDLAKNPTPDMLTQTVSLLQSFTSSSDKGAAAINDLATKLVTAGASAAEAQQIINQLNGSLGEMNTLAQQTNFESMSAQLKESIITLKDGEVAAQKYKIEQANLTDEQKKSLLTLADQEQAEKNNKKAREESAQAAKKSAGEQAAVNKQIGQMKSALDTATLSMQGLDKEAYVNQAVSKLSSAATAEQRKQVADYAAAAFDASQRQQDLNAAIDADPLRKENKSYGDSSKQLERQFQSGLVTQEQYNQQSEQLAVQHQQSLAKIISQQAVTPQQSAAGDVDPVQALANENAQKLALIKAYEAQKVISTTTADQLIAAEQTKYDQQRLAALETQYRAQSALNDFTMSMIDTVGQRFGNMIVGMVTGTQSVSDAVRNLAATILDQAVGALVQMGVQALKNMLISQTATSASVAQAAVTGPAIAAAYAPAAAMTSLASFGANAAAAQAGIATTMATTQALALAGGRRYGGGVSAGNAYRINESGQSEVFQTSGGAQAFIPNKSGKVIPADEALGSGSDSPVNVVINNMASGTQVENQGYNPDTRTITLAVKEVARQMRNASGDVGRAMKDSWNVTSKSQ